MTSLKRAALASSILLFSLLGSTASLAVPTPHHPYIEFSAGGSSMLSQSSHGNLTTIVDGTGDQFISFLYGHMQQENAFGPALNLAVGAYLTNMIRMALSLNYFQADQSLRTMATDSDNLAFGSTTSYFNARTWLVLANIYANLGQFFPMLSPQTNPYVGVGAGLANNSLSDQATYYDGFGTSGVSQASSSRNFAYKLMAGINFGLTQTLLFNVQYAFVNAGQYKSGRTGYTNGATFVVTKPYRLQIYANQITAGLTYQFN